MVVVYQKMEDGDQGLGRAAEGGRVWSLKIEGKEGMGWDGERENLDEAENNSPHTPARLE